MKVTFPVLLLREADPGLRLADAGAVGAAIRAHGIVNACMERARRHLNRAVEAVRRLPGDRTDLLALAKLCVERQA